MAQIDIEIGGHRYELACRDGEEDHFRALARMIDGKAAEAAKAVGGLNETRGLMFAALLLADELNDLRTASSGGSPDDSAALAIEQLAERMELLADGLEARDANA
jgi:cell division protein ZapA